MKIVALVSLSRVGMEMAFIAIQVHSFLESGTVTTSWLTVSEGRNIISFSAATQQPYFQCANALAKALLLMKLGE
jgi:hypothetical protein